MGYAPPRFDDAIPVRVNLFSDTQTRPSRAMREAMLAAEVGDEQHGSDPTVHALCDRMAALLGKEAAMFLPSGTMCNEIALLTHCRPGDEVLAHETSHIVTAEGGAPWALAGVQVTGLPGPRGQFDVATLEAAIRPRSRYSPPQALVEVEQTANLGGGACWPPERLRAVAEAAHAHGLATHMDGARLMNAAVALGVSARELTEGWDSVWLDFTKGLGAPLGAVLAGSAEFIDAAWRWKQRLGGSLRQAGICAAACLYALDHNVERLAEDHANARALARGLAQVEGLAVEEPETNLVYIETSGAGLTAEELAARVRREGVLISVMGRHRARACTHLDVDAAGIEMAVEAIRRALRAWCGEQRTELPMRTLPLLAALLLAAGLARAQTTQNATMPPSSSANPPPVTPAPADQNRPTINPKGTVPHASLVQRFKEANTTGDGHLTRAQAEKGLPEVARNWDRIDTQHRGWVTLDQVRGYAGGRS